MTANGPRRTGKLPERSSGRLDDLVLEGAGVDEVDIIPWPFMLRDRLRARVEHSDRYRWLVLSIALSGLFTVGFTITILSVSIPRIASDLGSTNSTITWVITGPTLAFGVIGPTVGKAGDMFGHKRLYVIGLLGCGLFAALTAAAPNAGALIGLRVVSAAMGASTGPASLAMINRVFEPDDRVKALGFWSLIGAGAPVLGVIAGGPIVEHFGWRWIFIIQAPLCMLAVFIAIGLLPETEPMKGARFDIPGAVSLAVSMSVLLIGVNRGPVLGWSHPFVVGSFVAAPLGLFAFVRIEQRAVAPVLPLRYLRRRNFIVPIVNQSLSNFAYMGGFVLTPLLLQNVLGYNESHTGRLLITRPLVFAVVAPMAGFLTIRIGERIAGFVGGLGVVGSMLVLAAVKPGSSDVMIALGLGLSGLGLGVSSPAMTSSVANSVDEHDFGVAGATQQLMNQLGVATGIQVMQAVQAGRATNGLVSSFSYAYWVAGGVALVGAVVGLGVRNRARLIDANRGATN